ncbi:MAG: kelch repeat-containing protein [Segetibacter sp.]
MKTSYTYLLKKFEQSLSDLNFKFCFIPLALIILHLQVSAQDFTTISWGTAASQRYTISEAQGRVVNGKLYSFGGFDSQKSTFTPTKRAYVFDPLANTWSAIANLPYTPNGTNYGGVTHAGITTDGTNIYIAGGYTSNTSGTGQIFGTKQVWKYNISQKVYTKMPDLPISVAAGQLEYLNGKLHYIGGTNSSRTADLGNHYVLDLNNLAGGWATLAPLPNPRNHAGSAVYGGKIYFIGGQHGQDHNLVTQKDVHVYNPSTNTWTKVADLPVPSGANGRGHISSGVTVMGDRILVLGGEIVHGTSIKMVSAYSPATNSWVNLTSLPQRSFLWCSRSYE